MLGKSELLDQPIRILQLFFFLGKLVLNVKVSFVFGRGADGFLGHFLLKLLNRCLFFSSIVLLINNLSLLLCYKSSLCSNLVSESPYLSELIHCLPAFVYGGLMLELHLVIFGIMILLNHFYLMVSFTLLVNLYFLQLDGWYLLDCLKAFKSWLILQLYIMTFEFGLYLVSLSLQPSIIVYFYLCFYLIVV